jgi:hypothetical protein
MVGHGQGGVDLSGEKLLVSPDFFLWVLACDHEHLALWETLVLGVTRCRRVNKWKWLTELLSWNPDPINVSLHPNLIEYAVGDPGLTCAPSCRSRAPFKHPSLYGCGLNSRMDHSFLGRERGSKTNILVTMFMIVDLISICASPHRAEGWGLASQTCTFIIRL